MLKMLLREEPGYGAHCTVGTETVVPPCLPLQNVCFWDGKMCVEGAGFLSLHVGVD